jgi:hypothetical protein
MSTPATVTFHNQTKEEVEFGLWSAPHDHYLTKNVKPESSVTANIEHPDARIAGAWVNSNDLYPSNSKPFCAGGYFAPGGSYKVTLTTGSLTISQT